MTPGTKPESRRRLLRREPSSPRTFAVSCAVCDAIGESPENQLLVVCCWLLVGAVLLVAVEQGADGFVVVDAVDRLAQEAGNAEYFQAILDRVGAAADWDRVGDGQPGERTRLEAIQRWGSEDRVTGGNIKVRCAM